MGSRCTLCTLCTLLFWKKSAREPGHGAARGGPPGILNS
jgi:hypothetical protein